MFKIFCVICFTQMGALNQTLCFPSSIPLTFNTLDECNIEKKKVMDYMNDDLVELKVSMLFRCSNESKPIST